MKFQNLSCIQLASCTVFVKLPIDKRSFGFCADNNVVVRLVKGRPASSQNSKGVKIIQLLAMHHETTTATYSSYSVHYSSPWLHAAAEACKSLQLFPQPLPLFPSPLKLRTLYLLPNSSCDQRPTS
jgi:hypothetical protein